MAISKQIRTSAFRNGGKLKPTYTIFGKVDPYQSYENHYGGSSKKKQTKNT
jgi:hypothetical protein